MIRTATPSDIPVIHELIRELAAFEKASHEAKATEEQLREALFGAEPVAHALVAEAAGPDAEVVGFALWFRNFSTWTGTAGLYLEDLYIRPQARGAGYGKALLAALAAVCVERGYSRFEWSVLDWNDKALGVYRSIGALPQDEWTVQRLSGRALSDLAALAAPTGPTAAAGGGPANRTDSHAN